MRRSAVRSIAWLDLIMDYVLEYTLANALLGS